MIWKKYRFPLWRCFDDLRKAVLENYTIFLILFLDQNWDLNFLWICVVNREIYLALIKLFITSIIETGFLNDKEILARLNCWSIVIIVSIFARSLVIIGDGNIHQCIIIQVVGHWYDYIFIVLTSLVGLFNAYSEVLNSLPLYGKVSSYILLNLNFNARIHKNAILVASIRLFCKQILDPWLFSLRLYRNNITPFLGEMAITLTQFDCIIKGEVIWLTKYWFFNLLVNICCDYFVCHHEECSFISS